MHTLKGIRAYLIIVPCPMNHNYQNDPFLILPEKHTTLGAEARYFGGSAGQFGGPTELPRAESEDSSEGINIILNISFTVPSVLDKQQLSVHLSLSP